jgi:hypothetical protein
MSRFKLASLLVATLCFTSPRLPAQEKNDPPRIAPYLTDTAFGFARVQLDRLDLDPVKQFAQQYAAGLGGQPEQFEMMISVVQQVQKQFVDAGATDLYVVMELENLLYGPYVILEYKNGADIAELTKALQDVVAKLPPPVIREYKTLDGFLFAGDEQILNNITSGYVAERPQLSAAIADVESDPLQIVICPSPDQLRAIQETVPAFPAPFQQVNGEILARGIHFVALGGRLEPEPRVRAVIQSTDTDSAEVLLKAERQAVAMVTKLVAAEFPMPGLDQLADKLNMRRENDRLLLDFSFQPDEWNQLAALLKKPTEGMREQAKAQQSKNNLKQFGLAMHNWHDVYKVFPAHANYSEDGKPLLSWRVHLLPYLGQVELYQKFYLNEPWDSEHNKLLISQMPDVFAVPGSAVAKDGKTGYVFPILPDGSAITTGTKDGIQFKEITDGTSNTAMIIVADNEHSVIWTKPEDLEIDPDKPLAGLRFDSEGRFQVTFADGSVRGILKSIDPNVWLAVLTRAGEEVIGELP